MLAEALCREPSLEHFATAVLNHSGRSACCWGKRRFRQRDSCEPSAADKTPRAAVRPCSYMCFGMLWG